jgi:hypothetical protein
MSLAPPILTGAPLVVSNPKIPANSGASGGTTNMASTQPWQKDFSDQSIRGAAKINPAYAADYFAGKYHVIQPWIGDKEPLEVKDKVVSQTLATTASPNAWKKRTAPKDSDPIRFGTAPPQKPFVKPWAKVWVPPLAMFNDASQWVNRLMFNRPGDRYNNGNSDPPLKAQYFTPPPIETNNLAAGTLNAQLQLGSLAIQAQQLTISASNYYGGT